MIPWPQDVGLSCGWRQEQSLGAAMCGCDPGGLQVAEEAFSLARVVRTFGTEKQEVERQVDPRPVLPHSVQPRCRGPGLGSLAPGGTS